MEQKITIITATSKADINMEAIASAVQNAIDLESPAILNQSDFTSVKVVSMADEYPELTPSKRETSEDPKVFASWTDQQTVKMVTMPSMIAEAAAEKAKTEGFDSRTVEALRDKVITLSKSSVAIRVDNEDGSWFEYVISVTEAA